MSSILKLYFIPPTVIALVPNTNFVDLINIQFPTFVIICYFKLIMLAIS